MSVGNPTYDRTADTIRRLIQAGIRPDLLCTVNAETAQYGKQVYETLAAFDSGWMQFIPIVVRDEQGRVTEDSVTPEAYGRFLKDVFAAWYFHDLGRCEVQLFSEMALALTGKDPTLCWMAPECGNVLITEKDGGIYSCDHFVDPGHRIGNVRSDSFRDLLNEPFQKTFGRSKKEALTDQCRQCPYLHLCGGGGLKDRFGRSETGQAGQYYLCSGLLALFDYAVPKLKQAMQLSSEGKSPQEIMQLAVREERMRFSKVGRNDLCPCGSGLKFKFCCARRMP